MRLGVQVLRVEEQGRGGGAVSEELAALGVYAGVLALMLLLAWLIEPHDPL